MSRHLQKEIDDLKRQALSLCAMVEKNVLFAIKSLEEDNSSMALDVIKGDLAIDDKEILVEEECLKILALHQPVAVDLRIIISILKMNTELERIGDLAVNIAKRAHCMAGSKVDIEQFSFPTMGDQVVSMLKQSVDALVNMDIDTAYKVCASDDVVDDMNSKIFSQVEKMLNDGSRDVNILIQLLSCSRHLERIADHATNIAEDVIYMISGDIVRHHLDDYTERKSE